MKVPRGDRELRLAADLLFSTVKLAGHQPFLATDEIAQQELSDPKGFMPFVRGHLHNSGLAIILNHPELRGGLIEAGMAYAWNIPIWLCHQPGERVSSSMHGCADVTLEYATLDDLREQISNLLENINDGK